MEEGGEWTLQRLVKEVTPVRGPGGPTPSSPRAAADAPAEVLLETRVGALDLTVLKGGAQAVGEWAIDNGFLLTPDAPEVLDFYARRSPIFLAARFDAAAVVDKGVNVGDGTPVHITIPTDNPWVPLRILGLGRVEGERIDADVFVLTELKPTLLAGKDSAGVVLDRQEPASDAAPHRPPHRQGHGVAAAVDVAVVPEGGGGAVGAHLRPGHRRHRRRQALGRGRRPARDRRRER